MEQIRMVPGCFRAAKSNHHANGSLDLGCNFPKAIGVQPPGYRCSPANVVHTVLRARVDAFCWSRLAKSPKNKFGHWLTIHYHRHHRRCHHHHHHHRRRRRQTSRRAR